MDYAPKSLMWYALLGFPRTKANETSNISKYWTIHRSYWNDPLYRDWPLMKITFLRSISPLSPCPPSPQSITKQISLTNFLQNLFQPKFQKWCMYRMMHHNGILGAEMIDQLVESQLNTAGFQNLSKNFFTSESIWRYIDNYKTHEWGCLGRYYCRKCDMIVKGLLCPSGDINSVNHKLLT